MKRLDDTAMERLRTYRWPGNVRELENLVRRLAALYSQEVIGVDVVETELAEPPLQPAAAAAEAAGAEGLSAAVERHITGYFAAPRGGPPAPRLHHPARR